MPTYYEYKVDEDTIILIEGQEEKKPGGLEPAARGSEEKGVIQPVQNYFREAMKGARESARVLLEEINELQVSEAEIKFGLTATGGGTFVVTAELKANYEVTLKWKRSIPGTE